MAVSLVNANGDPISTFGSGNTAYAQGNKTNAFESQSDPFDYAEDKSAWTLLSPRTFGSTNTNQGETTQTVAGSTAGLGYGSLSDIKAPRGTRRSGGGGGTKPGGGGAGIKLNPDDEVGLKPAQPGEAPTPAHPDEPSQDDLAETEIAQENMRQGHAPDYTIGGNMQGRNAAAAYSRREGTPTGGAGSSYTNGGTSDAEAADINARAGI
jgi:hypothetical protein